MTKKTLVCVDGVCPDFMGMGAIIRQLEASSRVLRFEPDLMKPLFSRR